MKTRTDCRIYKKNSIHFLKNLLKSFPIKKKYQYLKDRIISCSIDTRKYRIYGLSDILLFSNTKNMESYFKNKSFKESLKEMGFKKFPILMNKTLVINEIFLCVRFLFNNNIQIKWNLEDWWEKCRDIYCVADSHCLDFFWYKYHWKYEQRFISNYSSSFTQALGFSDWLMLYNNKKIFNKKFQEKFSIKGKFIV